jgi:hypothetical protein
MIASSPNVYNNAIFASAFVLYSAGMVHFFFSPSEVAERDKVIEQPNASKLSVKPLDKCQQTELTSLISHKLI